MLDKIYFKRLFTLASLLFIGGMLHLGADTPLEFQNRSNISNFSVQEEMLTPGTVVKKSYDKELNLYQYRLSNNVRVNLKPMALPKGSASEPTPRIAFRLSFGRGELEIPNQHAALAYVTNVLFMDGGIKPAVTTVVDYEFISSSNPSEPFPSLKFSVDVDDFCFKGEMNALRQLRSLLSRTRDYFLTTPIYDEKILKSKVRETLEETYSTLHSSPEGIAKDKVRRLLANGDWKFGYPSKDESLAVTVDQIRSFLEKPLKDSYIELSIVGDFDVDQSLNAVLQTIGALPTRDKKRLYLKELRNVQFPITPCLEKTFFLDKGGDVNFATIIMAWSTRTPTCDKWGGWYRGLQVPLHWDMMNWKVQNGWAWYKRLELNVLAEVLNWRLDEANKKRSYPLDQLHAVNNPKPAYNSYGRFAIQARTKPEEINQVEQMLLQMVSDIKVKGISDVEFEGAINRVLKKAYQREEGIIYWLYAINCSQEFPDFLRWQKTFKKMYDHLKKKRVQAIANEILNSRSSATIKILPPPEYTQIAQQKK